MGKGYNSVNLGCLEISNYDSFLSTAAEMIQRNGSDSYEVEVGSRVERGGRTTVYRMLAELRSGKKVFMKYFEKDQRFHHNDVDGKLKLSEETEEFADSVSKSLFKKGLRVEKEGLVLKLSKD